MYLIDPKYIVIFESASELIVETDSGKSIIYILVAILIYFMASYYLFYPCFFILLLVWTFKKEWHFSKNQNKIICYKKVMGIIYDKTEIYISSIIELRLVRRRMDNELSTFYRFKLFMYDLNKNKYLFTSRTDIDSLLQIVAHIKRYLLNSVRHDSNKVYIESILSDSEGYIRLTDD